MSILGFSVFFKRQNLLNILSSFFESLFFFVKYSHKRTKILIVFLLFYTFPAFAFKVRFPDEELAKESVLPLIKPSRVVLNRNVSLKYKVELGVGAGFGLGEPFFFPAYATGLFAFHLTEAHAISVTGTFFPPLKSKTGDKLSGGVGLKAGHTFDPQKAPYPAIMAFLNYQYTPFYGKISLSKSWVMNLSIYGFAGPGVIVFHTENNRALVGNFGIGQKFYFNRWFGIRGDLGFYGYYGPAIVKLDLSSNVNRVKWNEITPDNKRLILNVIANVGLVFLI